MPFEGAFTPSSPRGGGRFAAASTGHVAEHRSLTQRGRRVASRLARAAEPKAAGGDGKEAEATSETSVAPVSENLQESFDMLAAAEEEGNDVAAIEMAVTDSMADIIAKEATSQEDVDTRFEEEDEIEEEMEAKELPVQPFYDLSELCARYGGVEKVYEDHVAAVEEGWLDNRLLGELQTWLGYINQMERTANNSILEFEYEGGNRLVVVGTDHSSVASHKAVRETMRAVRPEALVLEWRLGDDSLQLLAVPGELHRDMVYAEPPSVLREGESALARCKKFHQDRGWLDAVPMFAGLPGNAAQHLESGIALEEFAKQREGGEGSGPRGGTIVFGDADLRCYDTVDVLKPRCDLTADSLTALRDLLLAQAMRATVRTHKSVVAVSGKLHLPGFKKLLLQDKKMKLVWEGREFGEPDWSKDIKRQVRRWEKEAIGRNSLFARLMKTSEDKPLGTYLDAEAMRRIMERRSEAAKIMTEKGIEEAWYRFSTWKSSTLAEELYREGHIYTPIDEADLKRWLDKKAEAQDPGLFPFEIGPRIPLKRPAEAMAG